MVHIKFSLRWLFLVFLVTATLVTTIVPVLRGRLVNDRDSVTFGRAVAITSNDIDLRRFRKGVIHYLNLHLPTHGFVEDDISIIERGSFLGKPLREVHCNYYHVRRFDPLTLSIKNEYDDARAERLNSAMRSAIEHEIDGLAPSSSM